MEAEISPLDPAGAPLGDRGPCVAFACDRLRVYVYCDREQMGRAAAGALAARKSRLAAQRGSFRCVFAAAPSQDEVLQSLVEDADVPWDAETCVLHMDEYVGLPSSDRRSFRHYLQTHLFGPLSSRGRRLDPDNVQLIRGDCGDAEAEAARYGALVRRNPPDIVQGGVGEVNAHIAFNDPPLARFDDPVLAKVVELAPEAKQQQVNEGHFSCAEDVPRAITLTVPALTRFRRADGREHTVRYWSCVVPGRAKATAVEKLLLGPVTEAVPATVLRTLPDAALFLDRGAARELPERIGDLVDFSSLL
jgi:glucosamine-6-phosphate deaminase